MRHLQLDQGCTPWGKYGPKLRGAHRGFSPAHTQHSSGGLEAEEEPRGWKAGGGGYELPPLTRCASYANTMLPRHSVMPFYTHSTHSKSTTTCKGCH